MYLRSVECGFSINPPEAEPMQFTTKTKVPEFYLAQPTGQRLSVSFSVCMILDHKVNWRLNIESLYNFLRLQEDPCKEMGSPVKDVFPLILKFASIVC